MPPWSTSSHLPQTPRPNENRLQASHAHGAECPPVRVTPWYTSVPDRRKKPDPQHFYSACRDAHNVCIYNQCACTRIVYTHSVGMKCIPPIRSISPGTHAVQEHRWPLAPTSTSQAPSDVFVQPFQSYSRQKQLPMNSSEQHESSTCIQVRHHSDIYIATDQPHVFMRTQTICFKLGCILNHKP